MYYQHKRKILELKLTTVFDTEGIFKDIWQIRFNLGQRSYVYSTFYERFMPMLNEIESNGYIRALSKNSDVHYWTLATLDGIDRELMHEYFRRTRSFRIRRAGMLAYGGGERVTVILKNYITLRAPDQFSVVNKKSVAIDFKGESSSAPWGMFFNGTMYDTMGL